MKNARNIIWNALTDTTKKIHLQYSLKKLLIILYGVFPLLPFIMGFGFWEAYTKVNSISIAERNILIIALTLLLVFWWGFVTILGQKGVFQKKRAVRLGVLLPPLIGIILFIQLPYVHQLLFVAPRSWLIGLMVIRLMGAIFLLAWASNEIKQARFLLTAGCFDFFVGITALPIAWLVASGSPFGVIAAVIWNILGLFDFLLAIILSGTSPTAGPNYMLTKRTPVMTAIRPIILGIISFGVPLSILVHILSLWQLLGK